MITIAQMFIFKWLFFLALLSSVSKLSVDRKWTAAKCTKMKTARAKTKFKLVFFFHRQMCKFLTLLSQSLSWLLIKLPIGIKKTRRNDDYIGTRYSTGN